MSPAAEQTCLIIIPVLARPHRVEPLLADIEAATPEPHRVLFVADVDDAAELEALEAAGADYIVVDQPRNYSAKINAAYRASTEPLLLMAADDIHFHPGWLPAATALLSEQIQVVGTNDLGNRRVMKGDHSTHTLFTRHYIETESGVIDEPDTVLHEGYPHDYTDDEFIGTAKSRGRFTVALDSHVEHLHPAWNKGESDPVYEKAKRQVRVGKRLFASRRALWEAPQSVAVQAPAAGPHRTAIFTACFGGYDTPMPQVVQNRPVDWLFFTDDPAVRAPAPWQVRILPPSELPPRMAAREVRARPGKFLAGYDTGIWSDGHREGTRAGFVDEALASVRNGVAVWKHPQRQCIFDEASASERLQPVKYAGQPMREQVGAYRDLGYPANNGLFACGTMVWELANEGAMRLGELWYQECERWSIQDQLSLPFVCWALGIQPGVFPHRQVSHRRLANPWLKIHPHLEEEH